MVVWNDSRFTHKLGEGAVLGDIDSAEVLDVPPDLEITDPAIVSRVDCSKQEPKKKKLLEALKLPVLLSDEFQQLEDFLVNAHDVFSLEEGECGEINIVQFEIDTGDAPPQKQAPRRMPFVVRQEVAKQLKQMQNCGVVQPSSSPWCSPVVMVGKRDGSH